MEQLFGHVYVPDAYYTVQQPKAKDAKKESTQKTPEENTEEKSVAEKNV